MDITNNSIPIHNFSKNILSEITVPLIRVYSHFLLKFFRFNYLLLWEEQNQAAFEKFPHALTHTNLLRFSIHEDNDNPFFIDPTNLHIPYFEIISFDSDFLVEHSETVDISPYPSSHTNIENPQFDHDITTTQTEQIETVHGSQDYFHHTHQIVNELLESTQQNQKTLTLDHTSTVQFPHTFDVSNFLLFHKLLFLRLLLCCLLGLQHRLLPRPHRFIKIFRNLPLLLTPLHSIRATQLPLFFHFLPMTTLEHKNSFSVTNASCPKAAIFLTMTFKLSPTPFTLLFFSVITLPFFANCPLSTCHFWSTLHCHFWSTPHRHFWSMSLRHFFVDCQIIQTVSNFPTFQSTFTFKLTTS